MIHNIKLKYIIKINLYHLDDRKKGYDVNSSVDIDDINIEDYLQDDDDYDPSLETKNNKKKNKRHKKKKQ